VRYAFVQPEPADRRPNSRGRDLRRTQSSSSSGQESADWIEREKPERTGRTSKTPSLNIVKYSC